MHFYLLNSRLLRQLDTGVNHRIHQVGKQRSYNGKHRKEHIIAHNKGNIALVHGVERNAADTVQVKHLLGDDGTGEQAGQQTCQAGDQGLFIYETDTDVTTFTFVCENNFVIPVGDEPYVQEDGTIIVASAEALKKAIAIAEQGATIVLADGTFEGLFYVNGKSLNFEALNAGKATINGKLAIAASGKTVNVKDIVFENSFTGSVTTGVSTTGSTSAGASTTCSVTTGVSTTGSTAAGASITGSVSTGVSVIGSATIGVMRISSVSSALDFLRGLFVPVTMVTPTERFSWFVLYCLVYL